MARGIVTGLSTALLLGGATGCASSEEAIQTAEVTARYVDCAASAATESTATKPTATEPVADLDAALPPPQIVSSTWHTNYQVGVIVCGKPVVYDVVCWPHCRVTHAHIFTAPDE